ncbi:hypothetical protein BJ684DRAFT_148, partial [Piptocephalis cylindrospora]
VPVSIHVMSKCPDAIACESVVSDVLEQVGEIVDFTVDYITTSSSTPAKLECMHGPAECDGNKQQLCFAKEYPQWRTWYPFIICQNHHWTTLPSRSLAASCAAQVGGDYEGWVEECVKGSEGKALLAASAARTKSRGIQRSCTVQISGKNRCIRDGGVWKDCPGGGKASDFVRDICKAY